MALFRLFCVITPSFRVTAPYFASSNMYIGSGIKEPFDPVHFVCNIGYLRTIADEIADDKKRDRRTKCHINIFIEDSYKNVYIAVGQLIPLTIWRSLKHIYT